MILSGGLVRAKPRTIRGKRRLISNYPCNIIEGFEKPLIETSICS